MFEFIILVVIGIFVVAMFSLLGFLKGYSSGQISGMKDAEWEYLKLSEKADQEKKAKRREIIKKVEHLKVVK